MSPLSNANYDKIVNVIYTIVSDKLHRINKAGIIKKNGKILSSVIGGQFVQKNSVKDVRAKIFLR